MLATVSTNWAGSATIDFVVANPIPSSVPESCNAPLLQFTSESLEPPFGSPESEGLRSTWSRGRSHTGSSWPTSLLSVVPSLFQGVSHAPTVLEKCSYDPRCSRSLRRERRSNLRQSWLRSAGSCCTGSIGAVNRLTGLCWSSTTPTHFKGIGTALTRTMQIQTSAVPLCEVASR